MTLSFEMVTEDMWVSGELLLKGKEPGYRVMVWVNYDLISCHKVYFCVEKGSRLTLRDWPVPVFYDCSTRHSSQRLDDLNYAIRTFTFADFHMPPPLSYDGCGDDGYDDFDSYGATVDSDSDVEEDYGGDEDYDDEKEDREEDESEEEDIEEDEENTKEYIEDQFSKFLEEVEQEYHPMLKANFQQNIESMVEALRSQVKNDSFHE